MSFLFLPTGLELEWAYSRTQGRTPLSEQLQFSGLLSPMGWLTAGGRREGVTVAGCTGTQLLPNGRKEF